MKIEFHKYQGTGNDFIVIDDLNRDFPSNDSKLIAELCDRKFGIGSDGILLLQSSPQKDFYLDFINPDSSRSFCGNGSRCAVMFARDIGVIEEHCSFDAIDGVHIAHIDRDLVSLKMSNVTQYSKTDQGIFLDTGSPHVVQYTDNLEDMDLVGEGKKIRYSQQFQSGGGTNVNFLSRQGDNIKIRTYERGVEDETLSCGTGVVASAITAVIEKKATSPVTVHTRGGTLQVRFEENGNTFSDIWLIGPAKEVFHGTIEI